MAGVAVAVAVGSVPVSVSKSGSRFGLERGKLINLHKITQLELPKLDIQTFVLVLAQCVIRHQGDIDLKKRR